MLIFNHDDEKDDKEKKSSFFLKDDLDHANENDQTNTHYGWEPYDNMSGVHVGLCSFISRSSESK